MAEPEINVPKKRLPSSHVRFTERELKQIQEIQKTTGKSIPTLLKTALLKRVDLLKPMFAKEDADRIIAALNRHGNNLNQITKQINSGIRSGWNQAFNSLTKAYFDLRHTLVVGHGDF